MKKVLIIATVCALTVAFTGCKNENQNENGDVVNSPIINVGDTNSPVPSSEPENLPDKETEDGKNPEEKPVESPKPSKSPDENIKPSEKPVESPVLTPTPSEEPAQSPEPSNEPTEVSGLEEIIEFINTDGNIQIRAPFNQDITAETSSTFIGLTEDEFKNSVEEAMACESMMMPSNHSMCIIKIKDGADVNDVKQKIFDNCDPRKWICMSAEYVLVADSGDYVVLAMSSEDKCKSIYNGFKNKFGTVGTTLERVVGE